MNQRRTIWTLYGVNFLNAIGMWFFLPLTPPTQRQNAPRAPAT